MESGLEEFICSHLPSMASLEVYTKEQSREASRRDKGDGGGEGNKMDYEFENCQLSCIIQLRAPAQ